MNFETNYLNAAIDTIKPATDSKSSLPIYGCINIKNQGGIFSIRANNSEMEIKTTTIGEDVEDVEWIVHGKRLTQIINSLRGEVTDLIPAKHGLDIKSGRQRFKINLLPPTAYPEIEIGKHELLARLPALQLTDALHKIQPIAARQDVRHYMNGVCIQIKSDHIIVVATDGHRLGKIRLTNTVEPYQETEIILPHSSAAAIARAKQNSVEISKSPESSTVLFDLSPTQIRSAVIGGKYPNWQQITTGLSENEAVIHTADMIAELAAAQSISDQNTWGVKLKFEPGLVTISTNNLDQDEYHSQIACSYEGEPVEFGMNLRYLAEMLKLLHTEQATILLPNEGGLIGIEPYPTDESDHQYLTMPMQL